MYSLTRLNYLSTQEYKALTYPALWPLLDSSDSFNSIVAIGASDSAQPIGLILADTWRDQQKNEGIAEILSIFVAPSHRCCGIGTALLTALEAELSARDCQRVRIVYPTGKPSTPMVEHLLQKCHWQPPSPWMVMCQANPQRVAAAPWMSKYKLPSSYTIFPWNQLSLKERLIVEKHQNQEKWYSEDLFPFSEEASLEPSNSLGLRYQGQVVGWVITHRIAVETIRYTSLFVRQDLQRMGRAIPLLAEAIRRQAQSTIPKGIFIVDPDNQPMCKFLQRHMAPYLTSLAQTWQSAKVLNTP